MTLSSTVLALIAQAWAGPVDGGIAHHKQHWSVAQGLWLHRHDIHCDDTADYWAGGVPPWDHVVGASGLAGTGRDIDYTTYTICEDIPTEHQDAIAEAFEAYQRAGVDAQPSPLVSCEPMLPSDDPSDDPRKPKPAGWFADRAPDGEFVFDDVHGIGYASSDTDVDYYYVGVHFGTVVPALVWIADSEHLDAPAGFVPGGPNANWEMFINGVDLTWSGANPSEVAWVSPPRRHVTDVVMHEFMHALGGGHAPSGDKDLYPSVMHSNGMSTWYAHLGLEVDAMLYDPDLGPVPGTYELPVVDEWFLTDKYGVYAFASQDLRMHAWEGASLALLPETALPVGWEASDSNMNVPFDAFHTQIIEDPTCGNLPDPLAASTIDAIGMALPRFTSRDPVFLEVSFTALSPASSVLPAGAVISGSAFVTSPGDGVYSGTPLIGGLNVTYAFESSGIPGRYEEVFVYATVREQGSSAVLYDSVPLNVVADVTTCGL